VGYFIVVFWEEGAGMTMTHRTAAQLAAATARLRSAAGPPGVATRAVPADADTDSQLQLRKTAVESSEWLPRLHAPRTSASRAAT
jgi:hypothetical protein